MVRLGGKHALAVVGDVAKDDAVPFTCAILCRLQNLTRISNLPRNYMYTKHTDHRLDLEALQNRHLELGGREILLKEDGVERASVDLTGCVTHLVVRVRNDGSLNDSEEMLIGKVL